MRLRTILLRILSTIPICFLAFIPFMQDNFAWQYDMDGTISRTGSRYELILYIIIPIIIGWGCYYWFSKNNKIIDNHIQKNAKFIINVITIIVLLIDVLIAWILIIGLNINKGGYNSSISMSLYIIPYVISLLLIAYGNQIPRSSFRGGLGIKNRWTIISERVWISSQKWLGLFFVICGIIIFILNIFFKGENLGLIIMLPIVILVLGSYIISYIIYIKLQYAK